jgi:hypothetical protein
MPYTHDPFACQIIYKQNMAWYHTYKATSAPRPKPKKCQYGCNDG